MGSRQGMRDNAELKCRNFRTSHCTLIFNCSLGAPSTTPMQQYLYTMSFILPGMTCTVRLTLRRKLLRAQTEGLVGSTGAEAWQLGEKMLRFLPAFVGGLVVPPTPIPPTSSENPGRRRRNRRWRREGRKAGRRAEHQRTKTRTICWTFLNIWLLLWSGGVRDDTAHRGVPIVGKTTRWGGPFPGEYQYLPPGLLFCSQETGFSSHLKVPQVSDNIEAPDNTVFNQGFAPDVAFLRSMRCRSGMPPHPGPLANPTGEDYEDLLLEEVFGPHLAPGGPLESELQRNPHFPSEALHLRPSVQTNSTSTSFDFVSSTHTGTDDPCPETTPTANNQGIVEGRGLDDRSLQQGGPPTQTLLLADLIPEPTPPGISACRPGHQCMEPPRSISARPSHKCMASQRPRRKRRSDGLEVISFNGSCWASARDFLSRTTAHVVCIQETKLDGDQKAAAENWCVKQECKPFIASCFRSRPGEPTAGVGVLVRSHVGAVPLNAPSAGANSEPGVILNGWATAVYVECSMRGGMTIGSIYLECGTGIGVNTGNWHRIFKAGEFLRHLGTPCCLGGDFNCSPKALAEVGFTSSVQGRTLAPFGGTCRSALGNWSDIDFFVVSRHLPPAVQYVHQVGSEPPRPPVPIRLKLMEKPREFRERVLKKAKAFPTFIPFGPRPKPPSWETEETIFRKIGQDKINTLHSLVVDGVVTDLANAFDICDGGRRLSRGIGSKPHFVWRHNGGAPCGSHPASSREGRLWRLAEKRASDIRSAVGRDNLGQAFIHLNVLWEDLNSLHPNFGNIISAWDLLLQQGRWEEFDQSLNYFINYSGSRADILEKEAANIRTQEFCSWENKPTEAGGGAAHAYAKVPKPGELPWYPQDPTPVGRSARPRILKQWSKQSCASGPTGRGMRRRALPMIFPPWPIVARLTPLLDEEIHSVAATYTWRTGVGADQLHPKHLTLLSYPALFTISYLFYSIELVGCWPDAMRHFAFFLLTKPTGGFRTIGLLNTLYRIWARLRMPLVRQWGQSVPRSFFVAGVEKGH